ncbi:hypothetical protein BRADO4934 [Bradyrhizobium sp. ORS 278]|nr:hypothetical protein BRADO4934 [Bradyrhizobium sp. ORS 278]
MADPRVALTTASIPHPYPDDGANGFILPALLAEGQSIDFSVTVSEKWNSQSRQAAQMG